jgi:hypothetical protein
MEVLRGHLVKSLNEGQAFVSFRKALEGLDTGIDVLSLVPRPKLTYLREILIIIEHNAYHLGKIVDIRKAHGNWK